MILTRQSWEYFDGIVLEWGIKQDLKKLFSNENLSN